MIPGFCSTARAAAKLKPRRAKATDRKRSFRADRAGAGPKHSVFLISWVSIDLFIVAFFVFVVIGLSGLEVQTGRRDIQAGHGDYIGASGKRLHGPFKKPSRRGAPWLTFFPGICHQTRSVPQMSSQKIQSS